MFFMSLLQKTMSLFPELFISSSVWRISGWYVPGNMSLYASLPGGMGGRRCFRTWVRECGEKRCDRTKNHPGYIFHRYHGLLGPKMTKRIFGQKRHTHTKAGGTNLIKAYEQTTEKILVTPSTKQDLNTLKQPGERYGDVVARLVKEQKRQDYITHVLRIAQEGDFVRMDSDEEYVRIRDEVKQSAPRNRAPRAGVR